MNVSNTPAVTNTNLDIALSALRDAITAASPNAKTLADIVTAITSLSTSLTNGNARIGGTVTVSGTVTANAGSNLNTSALAVETGGNLAAIKADVDKIPAQGQALSAASTPVVLPATQITTLTPPAAITNFANETGGNLAAIKADADKIPSQGQALSAASMPVVLPATQITTLTPPAAITNFANETGGNLAAIKTDVDKIPSQGQALAGSSMPVVLPAAQITTLTPPAALTNFANETGGNLAAIKTDVDKIPSQGQAVAGSSMPVVLPATQITTLTPPAAITNFATETGGHLATVDTSTAASNVSLTTIAAAHKAEDSLASDGDIGVQVLGVRRDADGSRVNADGDYESLQLYRGLLKVLDAGVDPNGNTRALNADIGGAAQVFTSVSPRLPLPACNAVRRVNCQPKGF